jgi:hypothetical protein
VQPSARYSCSASQAASLVERDVIVLTLKAFANHLPRDFRFRNA